jgi:opacity protein-like surface antigen
MSLRIFTPALLIVLMFARPALVRAQSGAIVNGAVGVFAADDATDLEISGGIGYRFNRALAFGIEFTHVPDLDPRGVYALSQLRLCCRIGDDDFEGHATVFTTNVRVEVPTTLHRVIPFVVGGGGVASVTEEFPIYYGLPLAAQFSALGLSIPAPTILPGPQNYSTTTLAMALTLGGGASFLVTDHLGVDADLRVLKLLADNGRTIGRFQVGASYRF